MFLRRALVITLLTISCMISVISETVSGQDTEQELTFVPAITIDKTTDFGNKHKLTLTHSAGTDTGCIIVVGTDGFSSSYVQCFNHSPVFSIGGLVEVPDWHYMIQVYVELKGEPNLLCTLTTGNDSHSNVDGDCVASELTP